MDARIVIPAQAGIHFDGMNRVHCLQMKPGTWFTAWIRYVVNTWFGFIAPAGTPPQIVARLNSEINGILGLPDVKENLASQGFELASPMSPPAFMKLIRDDMAKWIPIVKASGATAN
jgi:hypothetical protein